MCSDLVIIGKRTLFRLIKISLTDYVNTRFTNLPAQFFSGVGMSRDVSEFLKNKTPFNFKLVVTALLRIVTGSILPKCH